MSSRVTEKERRRQERLRYEEQRATADKRRRWFGFLTAAILVTSAVAAVVIATTAGSGGSSARSGAPFGPHYRGLELRRQGAGVPTMMDTMTSSVHFHPQLKLFAEGHRIDVPANIGIDPSRDPMQMAGLHTHDTSGTIHVEGAKGATLGQFFAIWGVPFSANQLGPYRGAGKQTLQMWVDGKRSTADEGLRLYAGQRIVIAFGPPGARPTG